MSRHTLRTVYLFLLIFAFTACAASPPPPKPEFSYVTPKVTYLRECPRPDCKEVAEMHKGEQVEVLEKQEGGWQLVRVLPSNQQGWIRSELLGPTPMVSESFEKPRTEPASGKSIHFVAAPDINLNALPLISSKVVKVLKLNDKMEILAQAGPQWYKVRELGGGAEGWIQARFLKDSPVTPERPVIRKKAVKKPQRAVPKEEVPEQPEAIRPSAM